MIKKIKSLVIRYLILVLVAIPNLFLFYFVFTPITLGSLFVLFNLFFSDVSLIGNVFHIAGVSISIIKACVAGSAYYLLLILNLSVPDITVGKRIKMILFAFGVFLFFNLLRIILLTKVFMVNPQTFETVHMFFWYFGAVLFVGIIWLLEIKIFKINSIPIYSDLKYLIKKSNF